MSRIEGQVPLTNDDHVPWPARTAEESKDVITDKEMTNIQANSHIITRDVQIINKMGLHARPAMQFVDLANKFTSRITVCKKKQCVNAKSIMELLLLAAGAGTTLTIRADGVDAAKAVDALVRLVESKFGEE